MKKALVSLFLFGLFISGSILAQDKLLTADDAIYQNRALFPGKISQLQWIGQTDSYAFAKEESFIR